MLPRLISRSPGGLHVRRTLLLAVIALTVAIACAGSAGAYPVAHVSPGPPEKVIRYWTPERMKQALPAGLGSRSVSAAKPSKGGGTSTGGSAEVPQPYPSAYGKVFFTDDGVN
jgi:hypothetical protein